jgi:uncharacterized membrane protein YhaH (DUF805 family)
VAAGAVALVMGAVFSAGLEPARDALSGLTAPLDFASDFVAADDLVSGRDVYGADRGRRHAAILGTSSVELVGPYYPKPPVMPLVVVPLVRLGFVGASRVWFAVTLVLLWILGSLLCLVFGERRLAVQALAFLFLVLWPPSLHNLERGQWSVLLAAFMAAGWHVLSRGHPRMGGAFIGLAGSIKVTPLGLFPYLALRQRAAAVALGVTALAAVTLSLPAVGIGAWSAFLRQSGPNLAYWETWPANTLSVDGFVARLFIGGTGEGPAIAHAPWFGRVLIALGSLALVLFALALTVRTPRSAGRAREGTLFAVWTILVVLLNPLAWSHNAVLLLLPAALILRDGSGSGRMAGIAVAVALLSMPRASLFPIAALPGSPVRSAAVLSLHFGGALLLLGVAAATLRARMARTDSSPAGSRPPTRG